MNRKQKGAIIEYYRVRHNLVIQDFIHHPNYKICSAPTYAKIIEGVCEVDAIYDDLLTKNGIIVEESLFETDELEKLSKEMKRAITNHDDEMIHKVSSYIISLMSADQTVYPNQCIIDFINTIDCFFVRGEIIPSLELNKYRLCMPLLKNDLQICFYYLIYSNIYKKTLSVTSVEKVVKMVPDYLHNEVLFMIMKMNVLKYRKKFTSAIKQAKIIEGKLSEDDGQVRIILYKTYHGIYQELGDRVKEDYYMGKIENMKEEFKGHNLTYQRIIYYLAMNHFSSFKLLRAKEIMKELLEQDIVIFRNLILPYLFLCDDLHEESIKEYINQMQEISDKKKIQAKYYDMKRKNVGNSKLCNYLLNKIIITLKVDDVVDIHVFLMELINLGRKKEFIEIYNYYKSLNYVILKDWDVEFKKNLDIL